MLSPWWFRADEACMTPVDALPRRKARTPLVARFAASSAVVLVLVAVLCGAVVQRVISERVRADVIQSAAIATRLAIEPVLAGTRAGEPISQAMAAQLDNAVGHGLAFGVLRRIKIFAPDGRLIYSDDRSRIGQQTTPSEMLAGALEGRTSAELAGTDAAHTGERDLGLLLEAYVPLYLDADTRPDGAVELYVPYGQMAAQVARDVRLLIALLSSGLAVVWLMLCGIAWALSHRLHRELDRSSHLANHDPLTGLPNRSLWFERVQTALAEVGPGSGVAVLLLDLDGFKDINDVLGHDAGDRLLLQVADRLREVRRPQDTVARLGGDEFAVLLTGLPDVDLAVDSLAARVQAAFYEPFQLAGGDQRIVPSTGIAVGGRDGVDQAELMRKADAAMYSAKRRGGGAARYDALRDDAVVRLHLLEELRTGIARGELRLQYQPSVHLVDRAVTGVEALVRWQHPTRGLLTPDEFLPVAERSDVMALLTAWVLDEAVRQCAGWRAAGHEVCIAVNLSAATVLDPTLPALVAGLLTRHGLPASCLALEITETSVIDRPQDARRILDELVDQGVNIAVDDFGTGYASLSWLQQLPFNALKIDRSFVADLTAGGLGVDLVRYTIELAHAMGKVVVAEGVETQEQYAALLRLGCDNGQGYLIARPLSAEALTDWLGTWPTVVESDRLLLVP